MSEPEQVSGSAADAPGPSSDEFDPNKHIWDGTLWWSLDRGRWWDGTRWQGPTESGYDRYLNWLAWVRSNLGTQSKLAHIAAAAALDAVRKGGGDAKAADAARAAWTEAARRFGPRYGRVHRAMTAVAHASVLALLALPLVVLNTCAGEADVSGYQALAGFDFPASQFGLDGGPVPHFEPNVALALLVLAVLVGVASSWWASRQAALVRLGTAAFGVIMVVVAASGMPSSIDFDGVPVNVDGGLGTLVIPMALVVSFVIDGQALLRSLRTYPIRKSDARGP
jgi:hypothetical protein